MAVTDIDFSEGEAQDFLVEVVPGTLNAPTDILIETSGESYPVQEISGSSEGDSIFIMVD